jgi:hypothetical protein
MSRDLGIVEKNKNPYIKRIILIIIIGVIIAVILWLAPYLYNMYFPPSPAPVPASGP